MKNYTFSELERDATIISKRCEESFPGVDINTQQVLCLAEETGEFVSEYRRWAGLARRTGNFEDLSLELADVVIVAFVTAHRLKINLSEVVTIKLEEIMTRGWRDCPHAIDAANGNIDTGCCVCCCVFKGRYSYYCADESCHCHPENEDDN